MLWSSIYLRDVVIFSRYFILPKQQQHTTYLTIEGLQIEMPRIEPRENEISVKKVS